MDDPNTAVGVLVLLVGLFVAYWVSRKVKKNTNGTSKKLDPVEKKRL